jgi:predicted nucleic acid-binding Zn ribbon protein
MQRFSDPPLTVCPQCGGELHKQVSLSSFQLKGSGWYKTDYARKTGGDNGNGHHAHKNGDEGAKAEKTDAAAGKDGAASTAKTETKSETKTETKPTESKPS